MIACGNHLLTQVKDNQPTLRRKLEAVTKGRKPSGETTSTAKGRNRSEMRLLSVFPACKWLTDTAWEPLIETVLKLERTIQRRNPKTGLWHQTRETVFWVSSLSGPTPQQWNDWIRSHWRIENASHYVRDTAFAEDASRIRKNPDIAARLRSFAYNLLRADGHTNIKNTRYRAALNLDSALILKALY